MQIDHTLYMKRRIASQIGLALSMSAMAVGLAVLIWILYILFSNGLSALDLKLFTHDTPAPGTEGGGLRNAILGSLMIVTLTVLRQSALMHFEVLSLHKILESLWIKLHN